MKGEQSEIVGGACKLLRSGANEHYSGMVWGSKELKEDLISLSRKNDPVISIELGLENIWWLTSCVLYSTSG